MEQKKIRAILIITRFKTIYKTIVLILFISTLLIDIYAQSVSDGKLRVGASSVVITPPLGIPMAGQFYEHGAQRVYYNLYAKSIESEFEGEQIAVKINLTGGGWAKGERADQTLQLMYAILKQLTKEIGVAQGNITIGDSYQIFERHNKVYFRNGVHYIHFEVNGLSKLKLC